MTRGKVAAIPGVLFALFLAARSILTPAPSPTLDIPGVLKFFEDNRFIWLFTVFLTGLIVAAGTWLYAILRERLAEAGESVAASVLFGGWVIVGAIALVRHAMIALPAIPALGPDPSTPVFVGLATILLPMVWFGAAIASVALVVGGIRSQIFPGWFIGVTGLFALLTVIGSCALLFVDGFLSPTGDFKLIVLWSYAIWAALASVALARESA